MDWFMVFLGIIGICAFLILWYVLGLPRWWERWKVFQLEDYTKGSTVNTATFIGGEIQGQVEGIKKIAKGMVEVKVFSVDDQVERMEEKDLIPLRKDKAIAHADDDVWINAAALNKILASGLIRDRDVAFDRAKVTELDNLKLRDEVKDLTKDYTTKLIQDARLIGSVRRETSTSYSPYQKPWGRSWTPPFSTTGSEGGGEGD